MKRFAFTMLELVFVIIVIGILAVLAMPNFRGHPLETAAEQVASHIRYTQHLALVNDVYDPISTHWNYARPQISFRECNDVANDGHYYFVGSDKDYSTGHIAESESAIDPLTKKRLYWLNSQCNSDIYSERDQSLLLKQKYGVTVLPAANCNTISFDNMGRPYNTFSTTNPYVGQLANTCTITLSHQDGNATITVHPETGYVDVNYSN